jgi:hypothetical protein
VAFPYVTSVAAGAVSGHYRKDEGTPAPFERFRARRHRVNRASETTGRLRKMTTAVTGAVPGMETKAGGLGSRAQSAALATLCIVLFLTFLDNTVVSVGLADVQSSLHAGITSLQWVVNGYALTFAAFMLAGGDPG